MAPAVKKYSNYRHFLRDYYRQSKKKNRHFSYRYFARKAGFKSSNFLYLIINGKRNLTEKYLARFVEVMKLDRVERRYFETLVRFNQARDIETRRYYQDLLNLLKEDAEGQWIDDIHYQYLSRWYFPVVMELVARNRFPDRPANIRKFLGNKISIEEARGVIRSLEETGLIGRDEEGKIRFGKIQEEKEGGRLNKKMLALARNILAPHNADDVVLAGSIVELSREQFEEIRKKIRDFEGHIMEYIKETATEPDSLCHFNIQLLSFVKKGDE